MVMKKQFDLSYIKIGLITSFLFFGTKLLSKPSFSLAESSEYPLFYNNPKPVSFENEDNDTNILVNYILLEKSYIGFKEALAFKESRGMYRIINELGYLGKYQFGASTLKLIGIHNTKLFLENPQLQEKAFLANAQRNKWVLRKDIKRFVGQKINGNVVTESGILAAAHLAGPGSVKRYLRSYGSIRFSDAFGTNIASYMRQFSSYDTSFIVPKKKSKVKFL